jgi:hypothetical protein
MAHKYSSAPTLVNPRAALRSVGTVVVVVACKAHAHRPILFSLARGLRGALYYRKGAGCLYYCIINISTDMRMQRCNALSVLYQSPGTDFARPHNAIFLLGSGCTWRMEVLHRTLYHTARTIMQEYAGLHFNRPETGSSAWPWYCEGT